MPPADRFREAILAALGLASLLPMGCQPDPGPSATNGQFDSSGLDSAAEVSLDVGADLGDVPLADLSDAAGVPSTDLGDLPLTDLSDAADVPLTDLGDAADVPLTDLGDVPLTDLSDTGDVPLTDLGDTLDADSLEPKDVCAGQVRCYGAAAALWAVEHDHCNSKSCILPGADTWGDAAAPVCKPIVYPGPLPPAYCPSGLLFAYNVCEGASAPWVKGNECCYQFCATCQCGRPLWVQGQLRLPTLSVQEGPSDATALDPALAAIAAAWREDARDEHAAIASFHRLGLELMAAGAPAELLLATAQGAVDEVHHAKGCLQLAELADGHTATLGPLDLSGINLRSDLAELAVAAIGEGCVGETLAALRAATAGDLAGKDSAAGRHQQRIAQDELNHAALGWRVVAWALGAAGELRPALERAFDQAIAGGPPADPRHALLAGLDPDLLHAWGRLTPEETHRSDARALREIVAVCARALFASAVPAAPAAAAPPFAAC